MRAIALVGLVMLAALLASGCGGGSTPPTPTETPHVTTAAQVAAMKKRLEKDEELRPVYKQERRECEAVESEYEYLELCIEPLTERLARLVVLDEKLANELMHKAGEGCREALRAGPVYDRIAKETIEGCEQDIGKQPADNGGG
ncbi:MAG TPA: hypothetical protein VJL81_16815 [Solirubrobacterales bacterium]|nr:hypothetical protein [Solirubrobacterales bacterium]